MHIFSQQSTTFLPKLPFQAPYSLQSIQNLPAHENRFYLMQPPLGASPVAGLAGIGATSARCVAALRRQRLHRSQSDRGAIDSQQDSGFAQGIGVASSWESQAYESLDVKIILLDNRSYRQPATAYGLNGQASCLGAAQISWLAQQLIGSQRVCLIASGSPLSAGTRLGISGSPLAAYQREAKLLRTLYRSQSHQQILHLGGDLHYNAHHVKADQLDEHGQERGCIELVSSGMGSGLQPFSKQQRGNFGLITIEKHQLRLQLMGSENERNLNPDFPLGRGMIVRRFSRQFCWHFEGCSGATPAKMTAK